MKGDLYSQCLFAKDIAPFAVTTAAKTGAGAKFTGYNVAWWVVDCGVATDSDDTVTFKIQYNTVTDVASDAAATDWSDLSTDSFSITQTTSDTTRGPFICKIDLRKWQLTRGLLRGYAIGVGESDTTLVDSMFIFSQANKKLPIATDQPETVKDWTT
jgi:hypothetical protein